MPIDLTTIKKQKTSEKKETSGLKFNLDFLSKEITLRKKKLSDTKKERFYNQLGVLFSSGIDLGSSLQIVIDDEPAPVHKKVYQQIYDDVIGGLGFSEALYKTGQFTDYEYYSIKVGEESGRLPDVLKELTSYFELRVQQRRQLTGALSYPIMVMFVAVGAVIFMLNVVVPMFAGVFKRFGGELPPITRRVLNLPTGSRAISISVSLLLLVLSCC